MRVHLCENWNCRCRQPAFVLGTVQLSPDGSRVAYVAGDHLFVRRLDDLAPQDLGSVPPGTEVLAWSPDATTMAFASTDGKIRKIAATRGQPLVVSDLPDTRRAIGLVWQGGDIIAAIWRSGLYRVDARGGTMAPWLNLNAATEVDFHALVSLPDGRVVFATHRQNNEYVIESFDGTNRVRTPPADTGGLVSVFTNRASARRQRRPQRRPVGDAIEPR